MRQFNSSLDILFISRVINNIKIIIVQKSFEILLITGSTNLQICIIHIVFYLEMLIIFRYYFCLELLL